MASLAKFLGRRIPSLRRLHNELVVRRAQVIELEQRVEAMSAEIQDVRMKSHAGTLASKALIDEVQHISNQKDAARLQKDEISSRLQTLEAERNQFEIDAKYQKGKAETLAREIVLANLTIADLTAANEKLSLSSETRMKLIESLSPIKPPAMKMPAVGSADAENTNASKKKVGARRKAKAPKASKTEGSSNRNAASDHTGPRKTERRRKAPATSKVTSRSTRTSKS